MWHSLTHPTLVRILTAMEIMLCGAMGVPESSWLARFGSNLFRSPPSNGFNVVIVLARSQWYQFSHKYNGYIVLLKGIRYCIWGSRKDSFSWPINYSALQYFLCSCNQHQQQVWSLYFTQNIVPIGLPEEEPHEESRTTWLKDDESFFISTQQKGMPILISQI